MNNNKKIFAFGVFDILHTGHNFFLKTASKMGRLFVVVARDSNVFRIKGKYPIDNEKKRINNLNNLDFVFSSILGIKNIKKESPYKILEKENPDFIALGYDQKSDFVDKLPKKWKKKIISFPAFMPFVFKSSILRKTKE